MLQRVLSVLVVSVVAAVPAAAQAPAIEHQPVACVAAGKFPRLEARFAPAESVAKARVQFQAEGTRHWYGVAMARAGDAFAAVLPQPKKSLKSYRYYLEVTDTALGTSRTAEYTTTVGASGAACSDVKAAEGLASAAVKLEVPAGAPSVPGGFSASGVIAVGAAGAAVAAGATTAAAAGGGISTAVLIGGGLAVAGAGVAVAASAGGGGGGAGDDGTTYSGPFNGSLSIVTVYTDGPVLCSKTDVMAGTVTVTLDQVTGAVSGRLVTNGTNSPSSNDCATGGPSMSAAWAAPVTGTASNLVARLQQGPMTVNGVAVTTSTSVSEFQGALNGGVITGTMTFTYTLLGVQTTGRTFNANGTVTIPVTLR